MISKALEENHVRVRGTAEVSEIIPCEIMEEEAFDTEYLDLVLSRETGGQCRGGSGTH